MSLLLLHAVAYKTDNQLDALRAKRSIRKMYNLPILISNILSEGDAKVLTASLKFYSHGTERDALWFPSGNQCGVGLCSGSVLPIYALLS